MPDPGTEQSDGTPQKTPYVPLSVRHGGRRKRLGWRIKGWREAIALRLAPWLDAR